MPYVQFPTEVLIDLGTELNAVSSKLGGKKHGAEDCNGLGGDGQAKIQHAITSFGSTWKTSVDQLVGEIDKWGGLSKAIGDMVAQFDAQSAVALSPTDGGSGDGDAAQP